MQGGRGEAQGHMGLVTAASMHFNSVNLSRADSPFAIPPPHASGLLPTAPPPPHPRAGSAAWAHARCCSPMDCPATPVTRYGNGLHAVLGYFYGRCYSHCHCHCLRPRGLNALPFSLSPAFLPLQCYGHSEPSLLSPPPPAVLLAISTAGPLPLSQCYDPPVKSLSKRPLDSTDLEDLSFEDCSLALDLGNARSAPGVDIVPTFTTNNDRMCLVLRSGQLGLLRIEDAERLQVRPPSPPHTHTGCPAPCPFFFVRCAQGVPERAIPPTHTCHIPLCALCPGPARRPHRSCLACHGARSAPAPWQDCA